VWHDAAVTSTDRSAPARDRVLFHLKSRGPATPGAIAERLAITEVAVRQHLRRLEGEGLVEAVDARRGVGRPARVFAVTAAAAAYFPDTHAELTVDLLAAVRTAFGERGLDRVIDARSDSQRRGYAERLRGARSLGERVQRLAAARAEEGYLADWSRTPDGAFLLVENHCPICVAARTCQALCRDELAVFRAVLGPTAQVERTDHLLAGARRCAYRIAPRRAGTPR
jgi:predicted ArsR family transcriptional regulator